MTFITQFMGHFLIHGEIQCHNCKEENEKKDGASSDVRFARPPFLLKAEITLDENHSADNFNEI